MSSHPNLAIPHPNGPSAPADPLPEHDARDALAQMLRDGRVAPGYASQEALGRERPLDRTGVKQDRERHPDPDQRGGWPACGWLQPLTALASPW
jgi:hypothetical protein